MNSHQNRAFQALRRSRAWLTSRQEQVNGNPAIAPLLDRLDSAIAQLSTASVEQEHLRVAALERSATARRIRAELWSYHMLPIVTIARAAAPTDSDLVADVRMPKHPRNDERVLASAAAMARAAEPHKELFIDYGLAPDFIEQLIATTARLRELLDVRGSTKAQRAGTTAAARAAVVNGKRVVRLIDNVLQLTLRGNEALQEWSSAKHITADPERAVRAESGGSQLDTAAPAQEATRRGEVSAITLAA